MDNTYLAHHGVKGQKWGVRRYQNADGSLTDEGRRHYGYGSERASIMTENTKQRGLQGAKLGAKIGAGVSGTFSTVGTGISLALLGANPAVAVGAAAMSGLFSAAGGAIEGGIFGGSVGLAVGTVETRRGRAYIERYDSGLSEFEKRDLPYK